MKMRPSAGAGLLLLTSLLLGQIVAVPGPFAPTPAHARETKTFTVTWPALHFPARPRVAIHAAEWAALQSRPDTPAGRQRAITQGQNALKRNLQVPRGYGSWAFYYACADDATRLTPRSDTEHVCGKCSKVYTDERTLAAFRGSQHDQLNKAMLELAWAYAWDRDERFAAEVRRVLVQLATDYPTYPDRIDRWGRRGFFAPLGGRRYVQSLDEAVGIIPLAQAYDLTRDAAAWSDEDRQLVERELFRATATSLLRFKQPNNHQTWYNAGLIAIASALGDGELVMQVVTMSNGVLDQLDHNVGSDGLWFEGAMAYHNYALQPMVQIADMTRRLGLNLHEHPKLKAMITAPIFATYPDGSFPVINDSDPMALGAFNWAFEWGWKTYRDPLLAKALARDDEKILRKMLSPDAVAHWPMTLPSAVLPDAGLVYLRQGSGKDAVCAVLDFGPHGGGHGHYDKLNLMLYANGREWLLDPGRLTYSHAEYKTWVKTTAAHNTISINTSNQAAHTGELVWFKTGPDFAAVSTRSKFAYPDKTITRTLILTPKVLLDQVTVEPTSRSGPPHLIDLLTHAQAQEIRPVNSPELKLRAADRANLGDRDGYQHLSVQNCFPDATARWNFVNGGLTLGLHLVDLPSDETQFTAWGIGYRITDRTPSLVRRVCSARARFVTVYDLSGTAEHVRSTKSAGRYEVIVETADHQSLRFTLHPENEAGVTVNPETPAKRPANKPRP